VSEVCSFCGDVKTAGELYSFKGLLFGEPLFDGSQDGHFALGPFGSQSALSGQTDVFNVVIHDFSGLGQRPVQQVTALLDLCFFMVRAMGAFVAVSSRGS
jgi:hypothetical protein